MPTPVIIAARNESRTIGAPVVTSSRYMLPITRVARIGLDQARKENLANYDLRAADGSIPLGKYVRQSKRQKARTS